MLENSEVYESIQRQFEAGYRTLVLSHKDGTTEKLRLFETQDGKIAFHKPNSRNRGFYLHSIQNYYNISDIVNISVVEIKSVYEREIGYLKGFKNAFTGRCHKNLWSDLQAGYGNLDISDYERYISTPEFLDDFAKSRVDCGGESFDRDSGYHHYLALGKYAREKNLTLVLENNYKTTTVRANKPVRKYSYHRNGHYGFDQYELFEQNIKKHLENKEAFRYTWRSGYDVSVSGAVCNDGVYRAWLSLEYRGCGNGHYYLLINENSAVFAEND